MPFRMTTQICLLDTYSVVSASISLQQVNGNECDPSRLFFVPFPFRFVSLLQFRCSTLSMPESNHPMSISDDSESEGSWSDSILSLLATNLKNDPKVETKDAKSSKASESVLLDGSVDEDIQKVKRESAYFQTQKSQQKKESPSVSHSSPAVPLFQYMSSSSDIEDIVMEREPAKLPSHLTDKETEQSMHAMQSGKKTAKQLEKAALTASLSDEASLKGMKSYRRELICRE